MQATLSLCVPQGGVGRKVRATQSSVLPNRKVVALKGATNRKYHRKQTTLRQLAVGKGEKVR